MDNTHPLFNEVVEAHFRLKDVVSNTPLMLNHNLSDKHNCKVLLKREDLQIVRSYKLRGAYNKMSGLDTQDRSKGIVCASAGNHAQGVAYSCRLLEIKGKIYMPITTPKQKISQVELYGKEWIEIILYGDTFDDTYHRAVEVCEQEGCVFIHPFNDEKVIAGQGTVAMEILDAHDSKIDYVFAPIGGGGLVSGLVTVFKKLSPTTKIIGVEPAGAASMKASIEAGTVIELDEIDKFVDGAAVKRSGDIPFAIVKDYIHEVLTVPEGKICTTILKLYNEEAMVVEPAGALSIAALDQYAEKIKGKTVVCVVSGSNNDILRTEEIKERSLLHEGLKHYFMIEFPQRPGALKEFVNEVLGETDDIAYFQFSKKNSKDMGPAVVGVELSDKADYAKLISRMEEKKIGYTYLNDNNQLFTMLV